MTIWENLENYLDDDTKNTRLSEFSEHDFNTMCIDTRDVLFYLTYMNEKEIVAFFNAILMDADYYLKRIKIVNNRSNLIGIGTSTLAHRVRVFKKWQFERHYRGESYEESNEQTTGGN